MLIERVECIFYAGECFNKLVKLSLARQEVIGQKDQRRGSKPTVQYVLPFKLLDKLSKVLQTKNRIFSEGQHKERSLFFVKL